MAPKRRGRPVSSSAGYRKVADSLRDRLIDGEWRPGTPLPSLRALANEYRVGLDILRAAMTVMRQEDRVGLSGRRRLIVTPLMSVMPPMSPGRSVLLVLTSPLMPRSEPNDSNQTLLGILKGIGELQAPLTIAHSYTLRTTPPEGFLHHAPRGMLVYGVLEPEGYALYEKLPFSVVLVDRPAGSRRFHSVAVENEGAVRNAVQRLVALGHRRIAFLRRVSLAERDVDPDSRERQMAYKKTMREAGLPYDSKHVYSVFPQDTAESPGLRAVAASKYTAVICADTHSAKLLLETAKRAGRSVPRQLSIVCFQGNPPAAPVSGPTIDFFELGRQAAHLAHLPRKPLQCLRLPTGWHDCESVGPAP